MKDGCIAVGFIVCDAVMNELPLFSNWGDQ